MNSGLSSTENFNAILQQHLTFFNSNIKSVLAHTSFKEAPSGLQEAILYSLISNGKKIRSVLLLELGSQLNYSQESSLKMAIALECVHTYSLVHDDLPAMDNDDYRRGKLSSHKKWGENIAILVGDALQALSFEIISSIDDIQPSSLHYFAKSIGCSALVGGQYLDLTTKPEAKKEAYHIFQLKTAKLFEASLYLPCLEVEHRLSKQIAQWGFEFGMLFQLQDDLDDHTLESAHRSFNIFSICNKKLLEVEYNKLEKKLKKDSILLFKNSLFFTECIHKIKN